jgi:hypothetical protein
MARSGFSFQNAQPDNKKALQPFGPTGLLKSIIAQKQPQHNPYYFSYTLNVALTISLNKIVPVYISLYVMKLFLVFIKCILRQNSKYT